jgi:hypothetical protein
MKNPPLMLMGGGFFLKTTNEAIIGRKNVSGM